MQEELVFKIPVGELELWRFSQLLGRFNSTKLKGRAKNTVQCLSIDGFQEQGGFVRVTVTIGRKFSKWMAIFGIRTETVIRVGIYEHATRNKPIEWFERYSSVNWRKAILQKYGRYQVSGPRL